MSRSRSLLLLVEDDLEFSKELTIQLSTLYDVRTCETLEHALNQAQFNPFDIILLDNYLKGEYGFQKVHKFTQFLPNAVVILLSIEDNYADINTGLQQGAHDYLKKVSDLRLLPKQVHHPFVESLIHRIQSAELKTKERKLARMLNSCISGPNMLRTTHELVGVSTFIMQAKEQITSIHESRKPFQRILITGEIGSGKSTIAHLIAKNPVPFIKLNCRSICHESINSILVGSIQNNGDYLPGLFDRASGGVLYFNEVSSLPQALQQQLYQILVDKKYDPINSIQSRSSDLVIVASSSKDLVQSVRRSHFSKELFYILNNSITIHIPPLRERREDIPVLAQYFLNQESGGTLSFTKKALQLLTRHYWPGNVEQLQYCIKNAANTAYTDSKIEIKEVDIKLDYSHSVAIQLPSSLNGEVNHLLKNSIRSVEVAFFSKLFELSNGNISLVEKYTKLSRSNLYSKITKYGLNPKVFRRKIL